MTIDRRSFIAASSAALALGQLDRLPVLPDEPSESGEPPEISRDVAGDSIAVYTTADKTEYRHFIFGCKG